MWNMNDIKFDFTKCVTQNVYNFRSARLGWHLGSDLFEKYIRVGLSEQAQIVGDKILAAKKVKKEGWQVEKL